jgi:nucleoside-diphosphate-sugar epimerase
MKILIIGGTGLISTAITRSLVERGDHVTLYNRGQTEARIPDGPKRIYGDRTDHAAFEMQIADTGSFDCVIDMICYSPEEAESAVRAFRGRIGQLIFCSTAAVYSRPASRYPIREDEPRLASSSYGRNKARCEDILMAAHERGDYRVTIIRPAFTYGEGGGLPHTFGWGTAFIDRIHKGKSIIVPGDGMTLRAYCHIDDVGRTFVEAIANTKAFGQAYHVTGEEWLTWNAYYHSIAEAMHAPSPSLVHIPADLLGRIAPERARNCVENYQFNNIFDNSAAMADLNFRHTVSFGIGIRHTLEWLVEHDRIENSDDDSFEDRLIAAWERLGVGIVQEMTDQSP